MNLRRTRQRFERRWEIFLCLSLGTACAATDNGILQGDPSETADAGSTNDAATTTDEDAAVPREQDAATSDDAQVVTPDDVDPACKGAALGAPCTIGGDTCDGQGVCTFGIDVVRVGDGTKSIDKYSAPVFIERRMLTGVERATPIALPTATLGANTPFTLEGKRDDEGGLSLSDDGHFLVLAGYTAPPGTKEVHETKSLQYARVVARVSADGTVDTSTSLGGAFSGKSVRSATSSDGTAFWISGDGKDGSGGVHFKGLASNTPSVQVLGAISGTNQVHVVAGKLYVSTSDAPLLQIGSGLPTTAGQTMQPLPGLSIGAQNDDDDDDDDASVHGFALLDVHPDVEGVDTLLLSNGGASAIERWNFDGKSWTKAYAVTTPKAPRGLAARAVGTNVVVAASLEGSSGNALVTFVDHGTGVPVAKTFHGASSGMAYRGVAWPPR